MKSLLCNVRTGMIRLVFSTLGLTLLSSPALADKLILKNGNEREVIIEEEGPTGVKARVRRSAATIPHEVIERIEYATPEENAAIRLKWEKEEEQTSCE